MFAIKITKAAECLPELVEQTNSKSAPIFLTSDTETKAVLLSLDVFETLLGVRQYSERSLMPLESLQQQLKQALTEAGYKNKEQIVELVKEIKQEIANERQHNRTILNFDSNLKS